MVSSFFPSLFEAGVASVNFSDVVVSKSAVNDSCVIIKARRPMEFLLDHVANLSVNPEWIDRVEFKINSDRSLSVWDK